MADCRSCTRIDVKCCPTCKRADTNCGVWHKCNEDCVGYEPRIVTKADKIRNMTDEELAEFLCEYDACVMCPNNSANLCRTKNCDEIGITEKWLKSEVGE